PGRSFHGQIPHFRASDCSPVHRSDRNSILIAVSPFGKSAGLEGLTLLVFPDRLLGRRTGLGPTCGKLLGKWPPPSPRDSCSAPRSARTRSRAATRTATGGGGSTATAAPASSPRTTHATSTTAIATTSQCSRGWASTRSDSASSGHASSPPAVSSRPPSSTITGGCYACHEHGVTPILTFHHFTLPIWVHELGGFADSRFPQLFERYCERAARALGDVIGYACT